MTGLASRNFSWRTLSLTKQKYVSLEEPIVMDRLAPWENVDNLIVQAPMPSFKLLLNFPHLCLYDLSSG